MRWTINRTTRVSLKNNPLLIYEDTKGKDTNINKDQYSEGDNMITIDAGMMQSGNEGTL